MINLNDEQRYTLDKIKSEVLGLYVDGNFATSNISNDEIAMQIFEYFINQGYTYGYHMLEIGNSLNYGM